MIPLSLQAIVSPRHVGWNRAEVVGGRTLFEHVNNQPLSARYTTEKSLSVMGDLGFVQMQMGRYVCMCVYVCSVCIYGVCTICVVCVIYIKSPLSKLLPTQLHL
jgi:hypothetical protein